MNSYVTTLLRSPARSIILRNLCSASKDLPRLPVPRLEDTVKKYLKSVQPFLSPTEAIYTEAAFKKFSDSKYGVGTKLQVLLEERAKCTDNWLADWWLKVAYLGFRSPVVFYSSPGLVFPEQKFANEDEQLSYASKMIAAAINYKIKIDKNEIPQEKMGKSLLDMGQYKKVFGTTRIPRLPIDDIVYHPTSKHIIVFCNNHLFKVNVQSEDGAPVGEPEIMKALKEIVEQSKEQAPPIGILTSEHRDNWANAYAEICKDNADSLQVVSEALFTMSLDRCCYNPSHLLTCEPDYMAITGMLTLTGGGSRYNAGNRWYDKTIQFVVDDKGHNGLTYEHSPAEGQPIAIMMDEIVKYVEGSKSVVSPAGDSGKAKPEEVKFKISDKVAKAIYQAEINLDKLFYDIDLQCFKFDGYGKEFIKSQKISPDSYIQMAVQLAFYRIHKVPGAHYESAATRMFYLGRTETIRSCSSESINFCLAMLSECKTPAEKVEALKAAVTAHKDYTNQALQGLGVDRHLLGLKLIGAENNFAPPEIYRDISYLRSTHMRISTSQVASKCDGFMVYGPITHDGYACCYNPRPKDINFGTSAFRSCPETSANDWKMAIIQSLEDMKAILEQPPKSKL